MTVDKRSVFTDALVTLGTIHKVAEGTRDAIHIAGRVCTAGQILIPGRRVGRLPDGRYGTGKDVKLVGIVDPFLDPDVFISTDQVFWLMIFPRTITSLRHVWQHPDFPEDSLRENNDAEVAVAKLYLDEVASGHGLNYTELYEGTLEWLDHDNWFYHPRDRGYFEGIDVADDAFWNAFEVISGRKVPDDKKHNFFSCSC